MISLKDKLISSKFTFFYQVIFPLVWISGFGLGTFSLWFSAAANAQSGIDPNMKWIFGIAWVVGSVLILAFARTLRRVWLAPGNLRVKHKSNDWLIPLENITAVTETRLWNPKTIKIEYKNANRPGESLRFLAPFTLQMPFSDHPTVKEIHNAIQQNAAT